MVRDASIRAMRGTAPARASLARSPRGVNSPDASAFFHC